MTAPYEITIDRHDYTVNEATYQQILAILNNGGLCCRRCHQPYTPECPQVMQNMCLSCTIKYHNLDAHEYIGARDPAGDTHLWRDWRGHICYTTLAGESAPRHDSRLTLKFYGFQLPETYEGKPLSQYGDNWYIYGDVAHAARVVVHYYDSHPYQGPQEAFFILSRNGPPVPFTKQNGIYQQARRALMATKDAQGYIHLPNGERYIVHKDRLDSGYICEVIAAQIARALTF